MRGKTPAPAQHPSPTTPTRTPPGRNLRQALQGSETLAGLLGRVQASRDRLAAVLPLLPPELAGQLRAGPLDEQAWLLLVDNSAAAAKLRQWLPALQQALAARGWADPPAKVRVQPRSQPAAGAAGSGRAG